MRRCASQMNCWPASAGFAWLKSLFSPVVCVASRRVCLVRVRWSLRWAVAAKVAICMLFAMASERREFICVLAGVRLSGSAEAHVALIIGRVASAQQVLMMRACCLAGGAILTQRLEGAHHHLEAGLGFAQVRKTLQEKAKRQDVGLALELALFQFAELVRADVELRSARSSGVRDLWLERGGGIAEAGRARFSVAQSAGRLCSRVFALVVCCCLRFHHDLLLPSASVGVCFCNQEK